MTVAILQAHDGERWLVVGVFADTAKAEAEASRAGYTRWSVSEWGVRE
jgi:hypothetical protein